jgi:hypothetical protein
MQQCTWWGAGVRPCVHMTWCVHSCRLDLDCTQLLGLWLHRLLCLWG